MTRERFLKGPALLSGDKAFKRVERQYGTSAATTYWWLRTRYNQPAKFALMRVRAQVQDLTRYYPGGLACTIYRRP